MEEKDGKRPEDLATDPNEFEVGELDDEALAAVAGGESTPTNTNCGCPPPFAGVEGSSNFNCGCGVSSD